LVTLGLYQATSHQWRFFILAASIFVLSLHQRAGRATPIFVFLLVVDERLSFI
jgi:hypothetical protein